MNRFGSAIMLCAGCAAVWAQDDFVQGAEARGRLVIPVTLNGAGPFAFLVDTCLPRPVITPQSATYLRLPFEGDTVVRVKSVVCGPIPDHAESMAVEDLTELSQRLGIELAGLLPAHQPGFEVTIDFEAAQVRWARIETDPVPGQEGTQPPALKVDSSGAPCVGVLFGGQHLRSLRVDSAAADGLALNAADLEAIGALRAGTPWLTPDGEPAKGRASAPPSGTRLRIAEIKVGGVTIENPVCLVLGDDESGYLGVGLLRLFRIGLAYEAGRFRAEPLHGDALSDPPLSGYGLALDRFIEGFWTVRVAKGSPAHDAGLRTGDVLLKAGDLALDAAGQTPGAFAKEIERRLLAAPGTTLEVRARGKEDRTVVLTAQTLL